jgi:4-amino-4-deoxy-L-arabinose transferase-like glycosyltransferase
VSYGPWVTLRRWHPAVVVALLTAVLLASVAGRYGYHRDELYFVASGRHPAFGYPDQPPLTPLLARLFDTGSVVVLRLPSAIMAAAVVLLAGLMAQRLGARRSGQWLASCATALGGLVLGIGHLLSTATLELLGWVLITYLVLRVLQGGDRRLWLLVGLVGGVTFQANTLVGFLLLALALARPRDRGPWLAGSIALLIGLPYLLWQAQHGWPQLDVARNIAAGGSTTSIPRALFLFFFVLQIGPWLLPLWLTGLRRLLRDQALRCFGVAFVGLAVTFTALAGKPYYLGGLVPLLLAAGAQPLIDGTRRWVPATLLVLSAPSVVFALPLLPVAQAGPVLALNPDAGNTIGWASFADQVSATGSDIVITSNYGEAGALQRYTSLRVYSGHNGYGLWEIPPGSEPALLVGIAPTFCASSHQVGTITMPVDNDENGAKMHTCTPNAPWAQLWPQIRHIG